MVFRPVLAQQAVSADHRLLSADRWRGGVIDYQEMVANLVERILVAARQQRRGIGNGGTVLVDNAITQSLGALDVALFLRKPHLESAELPERGGKIRKTSDRPDDARWDRPQHLNQTLRRSRKFAVLPGVPRNRSNPIQIALAFADVTPGIK